jgi:hypothetical protein
MNDMNEKYLLQNSEIFPHREVHFLLGIIGMIDAIGEANLPDEPTRIHLSELNDMEFNEWFSYN